MESLQSWLDTEQSLHGFQGKPCHEPQSSAVRCEHRTRVVPELRVTTLTDRTVKRIQEKMTAELRFSTRRDKESWSKSFREETETLICWESHPACVLPYWRNSLNSKCFDTEPFSKRFIYLFISCCSVWLLFG